MKVEATSTQGSQVIFIVGVTRDSNRSTDFSCAHCCSKTAYNRYLPLSTA